jgi:hypothetical protein
MKEAAHLIRLAALFAAGLILFLVVRAQVVPEGFGKYGHYRAGALEDARARRIIFAGRETCATCHDEVATTLSSAKHSGVGCESCHGPQARHAEADDPASLKPPLPDSQTLCAQCHEASSAKPKWFPQVVSKEHSGGDPCKTCHRPHAPKYGAGGAL